tara:strand:+ start:73 stop:705 length:633 start_codon:yes stop_codon:yes gene_type:complete
MPNWCSNYVELSGESKDISRVLTILKVREDNNFFSPLLGSNNHKGTWYDDNIQQFGTKWDVEVLESEIQSGDTFITFGCESAWSPPVAGLVSVCKKYNLDCIISYEEPGGDFTGRTSIGSSEGIISEEDYEYREGNYRLNNEYFWENLECDLECDIEELGENYSITDLISETYHFLDKKDVPEMVDYITNYLKDNNIEVENLKKPHLLES